MEFWAGLGAAQTIAPWNVESNGNVVSIRFLFFFYIIFGKKWEYENRVGLGAAQTIAPWNVDDARKEK